MPASIQCSDLNGLLQRSRVSYWRKKTALPFLSLLLFVVFVSVHDAALLVVNQEIIAESELNPIGRWLIQVNAGSVWLFFSMKLIGTTLVAAVLLSLFEFSQKLGLSVALGLAFFQAILLGFLYGSNS